MRSGAPGRNPRDFRPALAGTISIAGQSVPQDLLALIVKGKGSCEFKKG
jgi:hypothetical protein